MPDDVDVVPRAVIPLYWATPTVTESAVPEKATATEVAAVAPPAVVLHISILLDPDVIAAL